MAECPYCNAVVKVGTRYCGTCGRFMGTGSSTGTIAAGTNTTSSTPDDATVLPGSGTAPANSSRSLNVGARLQGGRYIVKKILGQGGMGAALLANDLRLDNKLVVIKELLSGSTDPTRQQEDVRNFKREVSTLAHIDHPLIPSVTDHFQEGTRYFMVQEYVEGENLEARLGQTNQPIKEREALICASELLDILDYLAQLTPPIIHRDIKPANIIIGARDRKAHLVDFGIARADIARHAQRKQTTALGTPGYAPPEQYQGNADPRSDLYGLAATLHHILTNRDPRDHAPFHFPLLRALNAQISQETEQMIQRTLQNDINQRHQSAATMKQEVDAILRQRFGLSGNIDSYTLGTSGAMPQITNTSPQVSAATMQAMPNPITPVQPLIAGSPPPPPPGTTGYPTMYPAPAVGPMGPHSSPGYPHTPASLGATGTGGFAPNNYPQTPQKPRRNGLSVILTILILLLLLGGGGYAAIRIFNIPVPGLTTASNGIGVETINGESIGISDGSYAFDTIRENGSAKIQAAEAFKKSIDERSESFNPTVAKLNEALNINSNDAEALIYKENIRVLQSGAPYVTVVIATMLTGNQPGWIGTGRANLQGVYVAQKDFNDGAQLANSTLIRLVIANSGSQEANVARTAQQIARLASTDATVAGVIGWPYSALMQAAQSILDEAGLPMISPTASSDALSGISPYFFRVAPSNKYQAIQAVHYARTQLQTSRAAVFYDDTNTYTKTLARGFIQEYTAEGGTIVSEQLYTVGQPGTIPASLQEVLAENPDIIYFAGYSDDVSVLLSNPLPEGLPVLGGDALYQLEGYSQTARVSGFRHLRLTAFAYPDEWEVLGYRDQKPDFFNKYPIYFDPERRHTGSPYGYTRAANDVILSYDAALAMFNGVNNALKSGNELTPEAVREGLSLITGDQAIQGVSGQIAFDQNGDPIDKAIVLLRVSSEGHIQMDKDILGKFLVGS